MTNEYLNIFAWKKLTNIWTNEYIRLNIFEYIRIFECSSHTDTQAAAHPHSHYKRLTRTHPCNTIATMPRLCSSEHLMKLSFPQTQPPNRPVSILLVLVTPASADSCQQSPKESEPSGMTSSSNLSHPLHSHCSNCGNRRAPSGQTLLVRDTMRSCPELTTQDCPVQEAHCSLPGALCGGEASRKSKGSSRTISGSVQDPILRPPLTLEINVWKHLSWPFSHAPTLKTQGLWKLTKGRKKTVNLSWQIEKGQ